MCVTHCVCVCGVKHDNACYQYLSCCSLFVIHRHAAIVDDHRLAEMKHETLISSGKLHQQNLSSSCGIIDQYMELLLPRSFDLEQLLRLGRCVVSLPLALLQSKSDNRFTNLVAS